MMVVLGVLFAGIAGFLALAPSSLRRLAAFGVEKGPVRGGGPPKSSADKGRKRRLVLAAVAGLLVALLTGSWPGLGAGILTTWGCWWWAGRGESAEERRRRAQVVVDLPTAVELLAACLSAGISWVEAIEAVAEALDGPLREDLSKVAAQIRLGADPAEAWRALAATPETARLARAAARASQSGASLAPVLNRLARDQRRIARAEAEARARSAAIKAVAPLGLCFLPAFFFLGIVPSIAGIAQSITLP